MNELPKELTPELLWLVLGERVLGTHLRKKDIFIILEIGKSDCPLNIDTLTRLMKEWCLSVDAILNITIHKDCVAVGVSLDGKGYVREAWTWSTEFEAILKATHWVAKEKGFLSDKV